MAETRGLGRSELERIALIVIPGAQIDRFASTSADRHPHDVDEEGEALVGLRRQELEMAEMGNVENGLCLHRD